MSRKSATPKVAAAVKAVTPPGKARKPRATAASKAPRKPTTGTQRMTAAEIVARNAQIAKLREADRLPWEEIAARFTVDVQTARRGYDSHVDARQHEVSFERAMREMREYVAVLESVQMKLAVIARDPTVGEDGKKVRRVPATAPSNRERVAAMHELIDVLFKQIAIKQAIGDLPANFADLSVGRDYELVLEKIMVVLKQHDTPRQVFMEIAQAIQASKGGFDVEVPKTHLAETGT